MTPELRAHVERLDQTIKVGRLDKFVIVAEWQLNSIFR